MSGKGAYQRFCFISCSGAWTSGISAAACLAHGHRRTLVLRYGRYRSAGEWQTSEKLTRLCSIPEPAILSGTWDRSAYAMEAKILRPLLWFGLLEYRSEKMPNSLFGTLHYYRKTALLDRLLTFEVRMDFAGSPRH